MCGIAGIVSHGRNPIAAEGLKRMCDVIAHRGPDDAGYAFFRVRTEGSGEGGFWCDFSDPQFRQSNEHLPSLGGEYYRDEIGRHEFQVALGHRRLSIIDLSHYGHQPMASPDRRHWIVFNGEIYNYRELRNELAAKGHQFHTRSDTEVILHLWEQYGSDGLLSLDGMFAFALYDRHTNVLTLARDRFGVKPLYYACTNGYLVFASEIKAILASGLVTSRMHLPGLVEYLTFQNIFNSDTLFADIHILEPGQLLEFSPCAGEEAAIRRYHNGFPPVNVGFKDEREAVELVASSFARATKRQLVSDVPVGAYLSGGMDSGSIVAVAGRSIPRLLTFTGGFDLTNVNGIEQGFDERGLAEQLSYILQTEHYDVVLHAGDMPAAMERITWHMDDPRVGMCHQNWYVAKLASRFVKVCLAGAGGDELFGGYPWRYRPGMLAQDTDEFDESVFRYWHRLFPAEELPRLFHADLRRHTGCARESFRRVMAEAPVYQEDLGPLDNLLQRALFFEFRTFLHGFLVTEDHISMAHSLETRVPFLDNELADLAWTIPPSMKVNTQALAATNGNGHIESTHGKTVLRRAMEAYLPKEFTQQHKQGFSPPDENWYRGPSMEYIKSILLDRTTLTRPWFDQTFVQQVLGDHFAGRQNHRLLIWSLLSIEWLQRHFVDQPVAASTTTRPPATIRQLAA